MLRALGCDSHTYAEVDPATLKGIQRDQVHTDWLIHAHSDGPAASHAGEGQAPLFDRHVRVAAVRFSSNAPGLGRTEAARCARIFASAAPASAAVVVVWQSPPKGPALARLVVALKRQVFMTQPFDPALLPPTVRRAATTIVDLLPLDEVDPQKFADALDVQPLQRDFYRQVRSWMRRLRHDDSIFRGSLSSGRRHDILLRHLIRILFVWILRENGTIPVPLFAHGLREDHGIQDYHREVLRFLFEERLNTEPHERRDHAIAEFAEVPFLNGSLFEPRMGDDLLSIPEAC